MVCCPGAWACFQRREVADLTCESSTVLSGRAKRGVADALKAVARARQAIAVSPHPGRVGNLVVNDVDVTAFAEGEVDRRHPERVPLRDNAESR